MSYTICVNEKTAGLRLLKRYVALHVVRVDALLILWVLALLTGCSTTKVSRAGDAMICVTDRFTGFDLFAAPKRIYTIELPRVSLSEIGEHRFEVRGLQVPVTLNELFLAYPPIGPLSVESYREKWGNARLRVQFAQTNGQVLFAHTVDFATAQFMSDHARYTPLNFSYHLNYRAPEGQLSEHILAVTDYDACITVETPTRECGHFVRLRGEAYDYFGDRQRSEESLEK